MLLKLQFNNSNNIFYVAQRLPMPDLMNHLESFSQDFRKFWSWAWLHYFHSFLMENSSTVMSICSIFLFLSSCCRTREISHAAKILDMTSCTVFFVKLNVDKNYESNEYLLSARSFERYIANKCNFCLHENAVAISKAIC